MRPINKDFRRDFIYLLCLKTSHLTTVISMSLFTLSAISVITPTPLSAGNDVEVVQVRGVFHIIASVAYKAAGR